MEAEVDPNTEFSLHFPLTYDRASKYITTEPQRNEAVVGETIDVILIAKNKEHAGNGENLSRWKCRVEQMATSVTVGASDSRSADFEHLLQKNGMNDNEEHVCKPFASYKRHCKKKRRKWLALDPVTLYCPLVAALDGLPTRCLTAGVHVAVWSPHVIPGSDLICSSSSKSSLDHPLHDEGEEEEEGLEHQKVRQIVSRSLPLHLPPEVHCRHVSAAGNNHILVTVQNRYREDLCVENITVLPNANDGALPLLYHPILGPLAALAADSTSEESDESPTADVDSNSFIKVETAWGGDLPVTLQPLELQTFVSAFSVMDNTELNESQHMHLFAALTWHKLDSANQRQQVITHYRLPSVIVRKPGLVITALPDPVIKPNETFNINYTITNNLQDFISLRLVWNPEKALSDPKVIQSESLQRRVESVLRSVICHQPSTYLGSCKLGSSLTVPVTFRVLNEGIFELGQHLKLKLQYSVTSVVPPAPHPSHGGGGGHQRRGSITSTHSLPVDPRPYHPQHTTPHRSASMCPLAPEDNNPAVLRRESAASNKSLSSAPPTNMPTPTENSPVHVAKMGSHGTLLDYHHSRGGQTRIQTAPSSATMSPSNRSPVQMASPASGRPYPISTGVITPQQVLKRNCQVYVMS